MQIINICYASNNNFVKYLATSMLSMLDTLEQNIFINFYIINDGISQNNLDKLHKLTKQYENSCKLVDFKVNSDNYLTKYYNVKDFHHSIYLRLEIFNFLAHLDKVLYLDCDTIILNNIEELYNENIDGYIAGVVPEHLRIKAHLPAILNLDRKLNKNEYKWKYFNSGVLLINLKKINVEELKVEIKKINEKYGKNFEFPDQDLLNILWLNKVKYLPLKYNIVSCMYVENNFLYKTEDKKIIYEAINSPFIYHFTGPKPDSFLCFHKGQKKFLHYFKKTTFYDISKFKNFFLIVYCYIKRFVLFSIEKPNYIIRIYKFVIKVNTKKILPINFYKTKTHKVFILFGLKFSSRITKKQ